MRKKYAFLLLGILIVSLSFILAEQNESNNSIENNEIDKIKNKLEGTEFVKVIIGLKGSEFTLPNYQKNISKKLEDVKKIQDEVLSLLTEEDIKDITKLKYTAKIGGKISRSGLEKLLQNEKVKNIWFDEQPLSLADKDKNETEDNENCYSCLKWSDCLNHTQTRKCIQKPDCTNENNETPKTTKRCMIKIKEKIKIGECPEKCICTGSAMKCELEDGTRIMTIHAGKSGNIIVQVKGVNMTTNVTLYKDENGTITGEFKGNHTKIVKFLPDNVRDKIKERMNAKLENENIELDYEGHYQYQAHKKARLFGLFPVKEEIKIEIDSETGNITRTKTVWWGFLARDVKE